MMAERQRILQGDAKCPEDRAPVALRSLVMHASLDRKERTLTPFFDRLDRAVRRLGNPVLVGLDPRAEMLPDGLLEQGEKADLRERAAAFGKFCRGVVDVVGELVPAVKPQAAFFEELGPAGMGALADVIQYAQAKGLLVILDGKRNDIGSTAAA